MWILLILLPTSIFASNAETKVWRPLGKEVDEWYSHPIKCPKTALRFEEDAVVHLEGDSHEREIILPNTGYYYLSDNVHMIIGENAEISADECKNAFGEEVTVHTVMPQTWVAPWNWFSPTNSNPAKPDIEKIPCDSDEVVFNSTTTRVTLEGIYQLQMSRISVMDKWLKPREFGSFCKTALGQKMFENCEFVDVAETIGDPKTKACQSNTKYYENIVCRTVECPLPKCLDPIRPLGFCCPMCGASIQVELHHNNNIELADDVQSIIERKIARNDQKNVNYYSSLFNQRTILVFQINIMESEDYTGASVKVMEELDRESFQRIFEDNNYKFLKSGMAYDPTGSVNIFTVVFMPLLLVSAIFMVAYKMSYDDTMQLNWRSWIQRLSGRSQFIFAQFENVMEDHDGRITISHAPSSSMSPSSTVGQMSVETGVECSSDNEDPGMEMVAGVPEDKTSLVARDQLDEVVENISHSTESASLISVDM